MSLLAVDLAAKLSAVCHVTPAGTVLSQADSWGRSEDDFLNYLVAPWHRSNPPTAMVVEDLPHRLPFAALVKQVCRLQGRIIDRMACLGAADAVTPVAAGLGYTAPDLSHRILKAGDKALAVKVATDYCAAYLIGRWVLSTYRTAGTFDAPGTSRYGVPSPRRPRKPKKAGT